MKKSIANMNVKSILIIIMLAMMPMLSTASDTQKERKPVNLVVNMVNYSYTQYVYDICSELKITEPVYLVKTRMPIRGYVEKQKFGYVIYLSDKEYYLGPVIAHELVHIWQSINGRMDIKKPDYSISKQEYIDKDCMNLEHEATNYGYKLYNKFKRDIYYTE